MDVMHRATVPLTENAICAVLTLETSITINQGIIEGILHGTITAELKPGVKNTDVLTAEAFQFRVTPNGAALIANNLEGMC